MEGVFVDPVKSDRGSTYHGARIGMDQDDERPLRRARVKTLAEVWRLLAEAGTRGLTSADLEKKVGVRRQAIHDAVDALQDADFDIQEVGAPGEMKRYQLDKKWWPRGTLLGTGDLECLVRWLALAARDGTPDPVTGLLQRLDEDSPLRSALAHVEAPQLTAAESRALPEVLEALGRRRPLNVQYHSASRGATDRYLVSPQKLLARGALRLIVVDHDSGSTKILRLSRFRSVSMNRSEDFVDASQDLLRCHLDESFDGFLGDEPTRMVRFLVSSRTWEWASENLPARFEKAEAGAGPDGAWTEVVMRTRALDRLAAYLIGLGGAVRVGQGPLREAMEARLRAARDGLDRPLDDPP